MEKILTTKMGFAHTVGHDVLPLRCTELSATKQRVRELRLLQTQNIRLKEFVRFADLMYVKHFIDMVILIRLGD